MANSFGEFLKLKRQECNLTQRELAKSLYVSESTVSKWEKNIAHPDITLLPKLSTILGVTEHELITASVDNELRQEKVQAKKWRTLSASWNLFFYIAYAITILTCFICNLAVGGELSWFWIVVSALLLSFTITNLPMFIKKQKLLLIPISIFATLCNLLSVCAIYTKGSWFWIVLCALLLSYAIIFAPIYISKYRIFSKIRKYNDFISIGIDFVLLNVLLGVIYYYCVSNSYATYNWFVRVALPITLVIFVLINILICVKFFNINRLLKASIILFLIDLFLYLPPLFVKVNNSFVQKEILDDLNILKADFKVWELSALNSNIHCLIFLTIMSLTLILFTIGLVCYLKSNKKN